MIQLRFVCVAISMNLLILSVYGESMLFSGLLNKIEGFDQMIAQRNHQQVDVLHRNKRDSISQNRYGNNRYSHTRIWNSDFIFLREVDSEERPEGLALLRALLDKGWSFLSNSMDETFDPCFWRTRQSKEFCLIPRPS